MIDVLCILSCIHRTTESVGFHLLGTKSLQLISVPVNLSIYLSIKLSLILELERGSKQKLEIQIKFI